MCLTPEHGLFRILGALALALLILPAGCQRSFVEQPEPLQDEPVVEDDAMRLRQWTQTSAMYPNGSIDAGPTGFAYEPRRYMQDPNYYAADTAVFVGNFFMLPIRLVQTPPWETITYRGRWILPTHHAMPPLPPMRTVSTAEQPAADEPPPPSAPPAEPDPVDSSTVPTPVPSISEPATQPG